MSAGELVQELLGLILAPHVEKPTLATHSTALDNVAGKLSCYTAQQGSAERMVSNSQIMDNQRQTYIPGPPPPPSNQPHQVYLPPPPPRLHPQTASSNLPPPPPGPHPGSLPPGTVFGIPPGWQQGWGQPQRLPQGLPPPPPILNSNQYMSPQRPAQLTIP